MNTAVITVDIVSGILLIFMLVEIFSRDLKNEPKRIKWFIYFATSTLIGVAVDAASYLVEGHIQNVPFLYSVNFLSYSIINICMIFFDLYMIEIIREKVKISYTNVKIVTAIAALNTIWILWGTINGQLFTIENGIYVAGPWDIYSGTGAGLCFLVLCYALIRNIKYLGKRRILALGSFVLFPVCQLFVVAYFPTLQFSYATSVLSCEIIYIFIQDDAINEAHIREEIMQKISLTDTLTGLGNHRAYENALKACSESEGDTGAVFCDLNGLKYVNDNFGHVAGDDYIIRFANILRRVFDQTDHLYRISGDEFVILLSEPKAAESDKAIAALKAAIAENDRIASLGYACGKSRLILETIKAAEKEMYQDKSKYYVETGRDRRK